ncbi:MAG TPA: hypothetical protein VFW80_13100 [Gaiellaceae bacterium]|nr:hypothetical protein [Gaiellaceae bacterium]
MAEGSQAERVARNQALIREVNERIEEMVGDVANLVFLCECADTDCTETLDLSITEYESIRSSPVRFPIKPGHQNPPFERVVQQDERYAVVEKIDEAGEIARELDPRSGS